MRGLTVLLLIATAGACGSSDGPGGPDLATGNDLGVADAGGDTKGADRAGDALETTTVTCPGNAAMTTFNRVCSVDLDCMIAFHLADGCGSLAAIGLHRSEEQRWTTVESACRAATPQMPCPSKPMTTEDGKTGVISQIAVTCEAGQCRTCTGCRPLPPSNSDGGV